MLEEDSQTKKEQFSTEFYAGCDVSQAFYCVTFSFKINK